MSKNLIKNYGKLIRGAFVPVFLFTLATIPSSTKSGGEVRVFAVNASDPFYTSDANQLDKQWYLIKTKVSEAWEETRGSSNIIVAIVDTGIHASHIELKDGRVIAGYNTITDQLIEAGANSDDNGHGTAVAGIIGAMANNQQGIAGINWNISLMPIKAVGAEGTGDLSAVAAGIIWATDHGAKIINLSLGGTTFGGNNTLSSAISYAYNHNVLLIAAAGNDSQQQGINLDRQPAYPVCGDNGQNMILGVAATDINDRKAAFSDYGSACIDISAPGERILTTAYLPDSPSNNVLIYGSGTSLAVPMVSGIAALVKAANPNITNADLIKRLKQTADDIYPLNLYSCGGTSCNGFLGTGRINAQAAIARQQLIEGSLVRESLTGNIYMVADNAKRLVGSFVFSQRGFSASSVIDEFGPQLAALSTQTPLPPLEGTLVKIPNDPTVYAVTGDVLRPITYLVFVSRGYSFANVKIISEADLITLPIADWYWPPDGTLVLVQGDPTVYVMDRQVRRPVTYFVFTQRKLSFTRVISVSQEDFAHVPAPIDNYWLPPLDGTLIKSAEDPVVYVIEAGFKFALTAQTFASRGYSFNNIRILPQAELDVITPGGSL